MERADVKTFLILVGFILTSLLCCIGAVGLNKACEARGGHFEGYWGGRGMVCVGGENR